MVSSSFSYIIYSYKYLESDLIKHCHVVFIHSLGQALIVRSHSKVHRSRGNPKEIPTWASRVSNYSYFPWFNRQQTWHPATGSSCRRRRNFIYYIEYFRKAAGIPLLGVWCKNIRYNIPIITFVGVWPQRWPNFSRGDKPSGNTPTRMIIVQYLYSESQIIYNGTFLTTFKYLNWSYGTTGSMCYFNQFFSPFF